MRWRQGRRSDNVEDRRDEPARGGFNFPFPGRGGGMRFPGAGMGGRRGGMSGIGLIVVIVLFLLFGGDLGSLLQQMPAGSGVDPLPRSQTGEIGESPRSKPGDELVLLAGEPIGTPGLTNTLLIRYLGRVCRVK